LISAAQPETTGTAHEDQPRQQTAQKSGVEITDLGRETTLENRRFAPPLDQGESRPNPKPGNLLYVCCILIKPE
jgi:hypothetical protein